MTMHPKRAALVLAPQGSDDRIITGLTLSKRAVRVVSAAGIPVESIFVVRDPDDLERAIAEIEVRAFSGVVLIQARGYVVADPLIAPLHLEQSGTRVAVDANENYAGAIVTNGPQMDRLFACLRKDPTDGHVRFVKDIAQIDRVRVSDRARHPAHSEEEAKSADQWQFVLVNKPRDAFLSVRLYRPLARGLTRLFLRSPFSPNTISILSVGLSLVGCAIASGNIVECARLWVGAVVFGRGCRLL